MVEEVTELRMKLGQLLEEKGIEFRTSDNWLDCDFDEAYIQWSEEGVPKITVGSFYFGKEDFRPLYAIAHEIGHFIDCSENYYHDIDFYTEEWHSHQRDLELNAWLYAVDVLKAVEHTNRWGEFLEYAEECLGTYYGGKVMRVLSLRNPSRLRKDMEILRQRTESQN